MSRVSAPELKRPDKKFFLLSFLAVAVTAFLVYSNTFHSEFQFDDLKELQEGYPLRRLSDLAGIWNYSPSRFITYYSFALNYHFSRMDVTAYHVTNLFVHILTSCVVLLFSSALFKTPYLSKRMTPEAAPWAALAASLLFAAHPLQTGAVTYIIQRAAVLAAFFYLTSLFLYVRARLENRAGFYYAAFACGAAAMLCKQNAFTLPFAMLLCDFLFFQEKSEPLSARLKRFAPFLALLALLPAIRLFAPSNGALFRETQKISHVDYLLTQLSVLVTYLRLLVWPSGQNVDYDFPISASFFEPRTLASFVFLAALLAGGFFALKKNRVWSFGIFWFFLTLSVESGLVPIRDVIFEHRMYLPMFGAVFCAAWTFYFLGREPKKIMALCLVCLLPLAAAAYKRNSVWKNGIALWEDAARKSPKKARPYHNLSFLYSAKGDYPKSVEYGEKAVSFDPSSSGPYFTLGVAYGRMGNIDREIEYYEKAFALGPWNPAKHFNNMGSAYGRKGDMAAAVENFKKAIAADSAYPATYANFGFALDRMGQFEQAIRYYQKAIKLDPQFAEAWNFMAIALAKKGNPDQALESAQRSVRLNPRYADAYNTLGLIHGMKGDLQSMIRFCLKAVEIDPGYKLGYQNLAQAYQKTGDTQKAAFYAAKAR